jgi:hypothetical protein
MRNSKYTILVIIILLFFSCKKEAVNNIVPEEILLDVEYDETSDYIINEKTISNDDFLYNPQTSVNTDDIMSYLSIDNQYNTLTQRQGNFEWHYDPKPYTQHYFFGFNEYSNAILSEWQYYARDRREEIILWTLRLFSGNEIGYITFGGGDPENINDTKNASISYTMSNGSIINWENYGRVSSDIEYRQNNEIHIVTWDPMDGSMPPNLHSYINISRKDLLGKYLRLYLDGIDYILDKKWESRIIGIGFYTEKDIIEKRYDNDAAIIESLNGLTTRELAIFRNYIYARHNYRFRSDEWNTFFMTYYKDDYSGNKTNEEVLNILPEYEKHILELINEQEKIIKN